jgi:hypothetical protein
MKFKQLLRESNAKVIDKIKTDVAQDICTMVLIFANQHKNDQELQDRLLFVGKKLFFKNHIKIYYGKVDQNISSFNMKTKKMKISFEQVKRSQVAIYKCILHELSHYLFRFEERITKALTNLDELDAFCAELATFLIRNAGQKSIQDVSQWLKEGKGSLNSPFFPAVLNGYYGFLFKMHEQQPDFYHRFLDRFYNLLFNSQYKEI